MVCKHGLDEINCPICRISTQTRPINNINLELIQNYPFKPENVSYKKYLAKKKRVESNLFANRESLKPKLIYEIPKPFSSTNFLINGNKNLSEKLEALGLNALDKLGISKKVNLTKPHLNLEPED